MTKIVIFNCPPRSGKDAVRQELIARNPDLYVKANFKDKLIDIARCMLDMSICEFFDIYEDTKDIPRKYLDGLTLREFLIKISEEMVKPVFGDRYFGEALAKYIKSMNLDEDKIVLISDGGFSSEIQPLIDTFGVDSVRIVQWGRDGCSFDNDSRNYIKDYSFITYKIEDNNGTIVQQADIVENIINFKF